MEIFFYKTDSFENRVLSSKNQHETGRKILKKILKERYNLDFEIELKNKKPYLKNNPLFFNISHSNSLVALVFCEFEVGLDVEFMKEKNYSALLKYLKYQPSKNVSKEEFYQLWTVFEAEYKSKIKEEISSFVFEDYMVSISYPNSLKEEDFGFYLIKNIEKNEIVPLQTPKFLKKLERKIRA